MVKSEFLGLNFGDKRLNHRLEQILGILVQNSKDSFPTLTRSWPWLKGLYRFFSNAKITRTNLMRTHEQNTRERCLKEQTVLVIQDTTSITYQSAGKIDGLGYIDDRIIKRGMLVHGALAVSGETGKPLGIVHQQIIVRNTMHKKNESREETLKRKRESQKWTNGLKKSHELLTGVKRIVHVSDRESDIYDYINEIKNLNDGFVIRAGQNRSTNDGLLFESLDKHDHKGVIEFEIMKKGGRKGRIAVLNISSRSIEIHPPKAGGRKGLPILINIICAAESSEHKDKLKWFILTDNQVDTLDDCRKTIQFYKHRWQIEDFHKGLKTGCSIEKRQLETREQHEKLLSVFSVLAWYGLLLRYNARTEDNAELTMNDIQIKILKERYPKEKIDNSRSVLRLVAMLGGFIGRKSDGNPGWQNLIRGLNYLETIEIGVKLAKKIYG